MKTAEGQQWFFWRVQGSCGLIFRRRDRVSAKGGVMPPRFPKERLDMEAGLSNFIEKVKCYRSQCVAMLDSN